MISTRWSVALLGLVPVMGPQAQDIRGGLSVRGVEGVDRAEIEWAYSPATTAELSDDARKTPFGALSSELSRRGPFSLVDTVSIRPYLLQPTAPAGATGPIIGAVPPHIEHVSLRLRNETFVLDVVAVEADPVLPVRHVTAMVVSHPPDGHALFTVDAAGSVAGTIRAGGRTFRIVPSEVSGTQLVYSVDSTDRTVAGRSASYRPVGIVAAPAVSRLEKRHVQALMVADLQPESYADDGLVARLRAGEKPLGRIDPSRVADAREIERLVLELAPLIGASGEETSEVTSVQRPSRGKDRYVLSYRQVVAGIPVSGPRDVVLSGNGDVLSIEAALVDPAHLPETTGRMSNAEAFSAAVAALELEFGAAGDLQYEHLPEQKVLEFLLVEGRWRPLWRSVFIVSTNTHSGSYWVTVDVLTGETHIRSTSFQ